MAAQLAAGAGRAAEVEAAKAAEDEAVVQWVVAVVAGAVVAVVDNRTEGALGALPVDFATG